MSKLQYPPVALPGVPRENSFQYFDENGLRRGTSEIYEYHISSLFPKRPVNYQIEISAQNEHAFHTLIGASLARIAQLHADNPSVPARAFMRCDVQNTDLLQTLLDIGFRNDDAVYTMRKIVMEGDYTYSVPVGYSIGTVKMNTEQDYLALLGRLNRNAIPPYDINWLYHLQQMENFKVYGVWFDNKLIAETVFSLGHMEAHIEALYVEDKYRHKGIARSLVSAVCSEALRNDIHSVYCTVQQRNEQAYASACAMGFDAVRPFWLYPGINLD